MFRSAQQPTLRPTATWRRTTAPIVMAVMVAFLAAGCVASEPEATPSTPSAASDAGQPSTQAFAQCMRDNGVAAFPDPEPDGRLLLQPGDGLDPNSPAFQAALGACQDLLPSGGTTGGGGTDNAGLLKFAECMRENGVPDFPDPQNGTLTGGGGINPNSPEFQSAFQQCQSLLSSGSGQ